VEKKVRNAIYGEEVNLTFQKGSKIRENDLASKGRFYRKGCLTSWKGKKGRLNQSIAKKGCFFAREKGRERDPKLCRKKREKDQELAEPHKTLIAGKRGQGRGRFRRSRFPEKSKRSIDRHGARVFYFEKERIRSPRKKPYSNFPPKRREQSKFYDAFQA